MPCRVLILAVMIAILPGINAYAFDPPDGPCDYLIIVHESLLTQAQRLELHRSSLGLRTCLVTTQEIVSDYPEATSHLDKIRAFILDTYLNWDIAPTYLILIGDANMEVSDPAMIDPVNNNFLPSHLEYNNFFSWAGNSWFADEGWFVTPPFEGDKKPIMHVGRIPARDNSQLANAVDKIINYDSITGNPSWLSRILMLVGDKNVNADNEVFRTLNDKLYDEEKLYNRNPLPTVLYSSDYVADWPDDATSDTRNAFNTGYGFVNAFGNTYKYDNLVLMAEFLLGGTTTFTQSLSSTNYLPVVFAGTCLSNYFYRNNASSIAEDLLLKMNNRGAIAVIGATHRNDIIESYNLNKRFVHELIENGVRNIGRLFSTAKGLYLAEDDGHDVLKKQYMLIGDPALDIRLHPLPAPKRFLGGAEIEDAFTYQDKVTEKSSGISTEHLRIIHSDNGVYPIVSERMLKATMIDSPGSSDYIEWLINDNVNVKITNNMHLSFWMNIVESPSGEDKLYIDGNTSIGRIKDRVDITDQYSVPLNPIWRSPVPPGWQLFYADLSPLAGDAVYLNDIRLRYQTTLSSESGNLVAYIDDIRIDQTDSDGSEELMNNSFEEDKDKNDAVDFWTPIIDEPLPQPIIAMRRDVINAPDGQYFMQVYNENCRSGQGAQYIFQTNTDIPEYMLRFKHYAPENTIFTLRIIDTSQPAPNNVLIDHGITSNDSLPWGDFFINFVNPGYNNLNRRLKIQFIPNEYNCIQRFYIDSISVIPSTVTDAKNKTPDATNLSLTAYPNPFNPSTTISYLNPKEGKVSLKIFDIKGHLVKTLFEGVSPAGNFKAPWDGKNNNGQKVASGIYFINLKTAAGAKTFKANLLR